MGLEDLLSPSLLAVPQIIVGVRQNGGFYGGHCTQFQHLAFPRTQGPSESFTQHTLVPLLWKGLDGTL